MHFNHLSTYAGGIFRVNSGEEKMASDGFLGCDRGSKRMSKIKSEQLLCGTLLFPVSHAAKINCVRLYVPIISY